MSREKALWSEDVVWAVTPLTIPQVALPPLLMGFACKDGGRAGTGCTGRVLVARWAQEFISKWETFPTLIFYSVKVAGVSLLLACLCVSQPGCRSFLQGWGSLAPIGPSTSITQHLPVSQG